MAKVFFNSSNLVESTKANLEMASLYKVPYRKTNKSFHSEVQMSFCQK